jgi:hypothetical protein
VKGSMKFSHPIFGTGEKTGERITDAGNLIYEITFCDCQRTILASVLSPVADDEPTATKRAGIGSPRVKSVIATGKRGRPRKF